MTKHEIIDETVAYYSEDPNRRALKGRECMYIIPESGNMCAVGRCLENPDALIGKVINADDLLKENDSLLKPEYQGHEGKFWFDLQHLHDNKDYWNKRGLTTHGQLYVDSLKALYKSV